MASNQMLASKIMITFEPPAAPNVPNLATAVFAIAGVTERGWWGSGVLSTSMEQWQGYHGDCTSTSSDMWNTADLFYKNGGTFLVTSRVTAATGSGSGRTSNAVKAALEFPTADLTATYGSVTSVETAPFTLAAADTFACTTNIESDVATFDAAAATHTGSVATIFDCTGGKSFVINVTNYNSDVDQTISLSDNATLGIADALFQLNLQLKGVVATNDGTGHVLLTSIQKGDGTKTGGAKFIIRAAGSALASLGLTAATYEGTGDVASITSVTALEFKTVVEADIARASVTINADGTVTVATRTLGASGSIQCTASNCVTKINFDTDPHLGSAAGATNTFALKGRTAGAYANNCTFEVAYATSGEDERFNLTVLYQGRISEVWPNATMDSADDRYLGTLMGSTSSTSYDTGSKLVKFLDHSVSGSTLVKRPANGNYGPMTVGADGLGGIIDGDFYGDAVKKDGLQSFNIVADISMVAVPGLATATIASDLITYVETTRGGLAIAILDPPTGYTGAQIIAWVETTASLLESSECAAIWWPRLLVSNRWRSVFGTAKSVVVPPCGAIAGLRARLDGKSTGGKYVNAAGLVNGVLRGVIGFEGCEEGQIHEVQTEECRDLVFPKRINPITKPQGGGPIYVDGEKGLMSTGSWPFIWQRYAVNHIARSIKLGLEWSRHADINDDLLSDMNKACDSGYLKNELASSKQAKGCLKGYYVDTSAAVNPPSLGDAERTAVRIGLAVGNPNLWVEVRIARDNSATNDKSVAA